MKTTKQIKIQSISRRKRCIHNPPLYLTILSTSGIFLWSFRSWVYAKCVSTALTSQINSFAHLEGTTSEGKHGRDKAGYNLSTPTLKHAEDSSHPRYLIVKRTSHNSLLNSPLKAPIQLQGKKSLTQLYPQQFK